MVEVMNRLSHRYLPWRWFRIVDSVDASICCGKLMLKVASKKRESQTFGKINSVFVIYLIMCHAALITWRPHRSAVMPPPRYSHAVATPSPHRCCGATAARQDTGHATRSFTARCKNRPNHSAKRPISQHETGRFAARNGPFRHAPLPRLRNGGGAMGWKTKSRRLFTETTAQVLTIKKSIM